MKKPFYKPRLSACGGDNITRLVQGLSPFRFASGYRKTLQTVLRINIRFGYY